MHFYPIKLDACSTESVTGVILHQSVGRISLGVLTRENRISEIRHALVIVNLALLILIPSFVALDRRRRRRRRTNVHHWLEIFFCFSERIVFEKVIFRVIILEKYLILPVDYG